MAVITITILQVTNMRPRKGKCQVQQESPSKIQPELSDSQGPLLQYLVWELLWLEASSVFLQHTNIFCEEKKKTFEI